MLSKNKIKFIRSLELKKFRKENKVFLAEGNKLVSDLAGHFRCKLLVSTREWLNDNTQISADEIITVEPCSKKYESLYVTKSGVL